MDLAALSQIATPEPEPDPAEQPINYFPDDSTPNTDSFSIDGE